MIKINCHFPSTRTEKKKFHIKYRSILVKWLKVLLSSTTKIVTRLFKFMIMSVLFKFGKQMFTINLIYKTIHFIDCYIVTHQLFLDTRRTMDSVVDRSYCCQREFLNLEVVDCHSSLVLWCERHERFAVQVNRHATMVRFLFVFRYIFVHLDSHCPFGHRWPNWPDPDALMMIDWPAFCMPHLHLVENYKMKSVLFLFFFLLSFQLLYFLFSFNLHRTKITSVAEFMNII